MGGRGSFFKKKSSQDDELKDSQRALSKQLIYEDDGARRFIPKNAIIDHTKVIAGRDGKSVLRIADILADKYGYESEDWNKCVGQIRSDKYLFDIHWYEVNEHQMFDPKVKSKKRL